MAQGPLEGTIESTSPVIVMYITPNIYVEVDSYAATDSCMDSWAVGLEVGLKGGAVRNIPDINQILTKGKCWKRMKNAQFNRDFPSLIGEKINLTEEKTELEKRWNNLSSGQAPTSTLRQHPASRQRASHLPAYLSPPQPVACQPPTAIQGPSAPRLPPQAPVGCQPPTWVPGPTSQPIKISPQPQPIKKVPD
ncbi:hypothetical protein DSO57_1036615 [Entomophthora muscae]|uniref:Uncharacterized protein n=1 Tax=Entomophthora muscae TaxID=34485 RepID=A0ACC2TLA7_9FUNG|nr:hypothetical protein DSO57_1036615 [Entomophthora muscae]